MNKNNDFLYLIIDIWKQLRLKRKKQLLLLFITILLSGIAEVISLGSFIPFLIAVTNVEELDNNRLAEFFIRFLGIKSDDSLLLFFTITFSFTVLIATLIRLINIWFTEKVVAEIGSDFSFDAYRKTLLQPYKIHLYRNSSELIKIITLQVDATITTINQTLRMITSLFVFNFIFIFLLITDWKIAISSIFSIGAIYLFLAKYSKAILLRNSKRIDIARFNQIKSISEGLGSIRDVIINNKQIRYLNSYKGIDIPLRKWKAENNLIANSPRFLIEGLSLILISFLSLILIRQRGESNQVIPIIGAIALASQRMLPALQQIFRNWSYIKSSNSDIYAVLNILKQENYDKEIFAYVKPFEFKNKIEFKNVYFKYKNSPNYILQNINLVIEKGSVIGIIGETGSGKSSFIDLLMGLLSPTKGEILIDGKLMNENSMFIKNWQASISHVPQDIFLNDSSISENIAFGEKKNEIDYDRLTKVAKKAHILDFIISLPSGFDTVIGERGINLSGGQRQRLSIARSFYKDANVIVFDEATSALDNKTEDLIMKSLNEFNKEFTLIMIAHRITSLSNCTKILKFSHGSVEEVSY